MHENRTCQHRIDAFSKSAAEPSSSSSLKRREVVWGMAGQQQGWKKWCGQSLIPVFFVRMTHRLCLSDCPGGGLWSGASPGASELRRGFSSRGPSPPPRPAHLPPVAASSPWSFLSAPFFLWGLRASSLYTGVPTSHRQISPALRTSLPVLQSSSYPVMKVFNDRNCLYVLFALYQETHHKQNAQWIVFLIKK